MKDTTVSIAEGKKGFSRLIQGALDKKERVIITKRQKPVAVIIPYDEYQRSRRFEGYKKIMEVREAYLKAGVKARDAHKESKKQLEDRS
jgi:prevent-host-death family protein